MRIPVVPLAVAGTLIAIVLYLFNSASSGQKVLGEPRIEKLVDLEGDETEMAIAPDGTRLLAVASGDLWLFNLSDNSRKRLTETPEFETFPAWAPDGNRLTFTRGNDTFVASGPGFETSALLKEDATSLSWSASGRAAFVRNRTLWVTDAGGINDQLLIEPDANPDISIRNPRFSPDSLQLAYVRTNLGLNGEVWLADATTGAARAIVADRWSENPLDVGWLGDGKQLVYLTNRSGAYAIWIINFEANTLGPLTKPLDSIQLGRTGLAVRQDRIFAARHAVNSDIVNSAGAVVAGSSDAELEPALSPDGKLVAYTLQKDNRSEVWTANADGSNPLFRALGTQPRFAPNGFELVYTQTDIEGHMDLRRLDIRDNSADTITDAGEIDFQPDWSPDGRSIAFASGKTGAMALWTLPSTGGKRTRINDNGYYPRFSPNGRSIAYWSQGAVWTADASGKNARRVQSDVMTPTPASWINGAPKISSDPDVAMGRETLAAFDTLPDGKMVLAAVASKETAVWTITLTYTEKK